MISYYDGTNVVGQGNEDLKVAKCGNAKCSSSNTITTVDSAGDVGWDTSIAIGTDGFPVISYLDFTKTNLKVAKCGNKECSPLNTITITTVDSAGDVGDYTSIAIGAESPVGFPVISYYDYTNANRDLKVAKCGNAACSSSNTITTVDSAGDVGGSTSIAIGTDGFPVISYYDTTNENLKVAKCGNAACSSSNTITVDSDGDVGAYTSIAIGTESPVGFPVISYLDFTNTALKVAKCGNKECSPLNTITITTVDSDDHVGWNTSIAIGTDGFPVISYLDRTNNNLKVAKCGNAACSSSNTITVDSAGNVGGDSTSIAIGTDGFPVISYYDSVNRRLKVAKCANATCN